MGNVSVLRALAPVGAVLTALAGATVLWLTVRLPALGVEDPGGAAAAVAFVVGMSVLAVAGALLIRQRPADTAGWLLLATGFAGALSRLAFGLAVWAREESHGAASALAWVTNWSWMPAQAFALLLILHFPDGRLPSGRWRIVQVAVVLWTVTACVAGALVPGSVAAEQLEPLANPLGIERADVFLNHTLSVLFVAMPVLVVVTALAPLLRWRMSSADERRQINGVIAAILVVAVSAPVALATDTGALVEGLAWLLFPAAIAHALLRRQLWDVDLRRRFDRMRAVREEERLRLQRDLHDSLGPILGSISMRSEATRNLVSAGAASAQVDEQLVGIGQAAQAAVVEVRRIIDELQPTALDENDLKSAVAGLIAGHASTATTFELFADGVPDLRPAVEAAAYRIAAEAIRNVVRHSGADRCIVAVGVDDQDRLHLEITDDGEGLRGAPPGVGRRSMADRAARLGGSLRVVEQGTGGVRVTAQFPGAIA